METLRSHTSTRLHCACVEPVEPCDAHTLQTETSEPNGSMFFHVQCHPKVLPTKPVRTTSALVGKAYSAAGQAAACLHTMSLMQAYQAELLGELDEGGGIGPNAVCELGHKRAQATRAVLPEAERLTPHYLVPVSLLCPQGTVMLTLPTRVLQCAAVSGEHISQGPPRNVVVLGCPPPLRRFPEQPVQSYPASSPLQGDGLTAQQQLNSSAAILVSSHITL